MRCVIKSCKHHIFATTDQYDFPVVIVHGDESSSVRTRQGDR